MKHNTYTKTDSFLEQAEDIIGLQTASLEIGQEGT